MGLGRRSKTSPEAMRHAERRKRACELRLVGKKSFREIAAEMGCSLGMAHKLVRTAVEQVPQANAEELRDLRVSQLDEIIVDLRKVLTAWRAAALSGGIGAADLYVKAADKLAGVIEKASKIEGSAAPAKQEVTGKDGAPLAGQPSPAEAARLVREAFGEHGAKGAQNVESTPEVPPDTPTE